MRLITILLSLTIVAMLGIWMVNWRLSSNGNQNTESAIKQAYDSQRISDLRALETAVVSFWTGKQKYPQALSDLTPQYINTLPTDPETNETYGYEKDSNGFKLYCKLWDKSKMESDGGNDPNYYEVGNNPDL